MNAWIDMAQPAWRLAGWQLAGWTMLHFLWLGTATAIGGGVLRLAVRRASPNVRYAASLITLAVLAALPIAIAVAVGQGHLLGSFSETAIPPASDNATTLGVEDVPESASGGDAATWGRLSLAGGSESRRDSATVVIDLARAEAVAPSGAAGVADVAIVDATVGNPSPSPSLRGRGILGRLAMWLPWAWLVGAPATFALLAAGLAGSWRLRAGSAAIVDGPVFDACRQMQVSLGVTRRVALAACDCLVQPVLVGIVRPTILLPAAALTGWSPEELEMVLAHELAHVRRWDNLVNLAQRLIESLLFFHPCVWLASRQVRRDREECCDALVVQHTAQPEAYATLLVSIAAAVRARRSEPGRPRPRLLGSAMANHPLAGRVRRILKLEDETMRVSRRSLAMVVAAAVAVASGLYYHNAAAEDSTSPEQAEDAADRVDARAYPIRDIETIDLHKWLRLAESLRARGAEITWHDPSSSLTLTATKEGHQELANLLAEARAENAAATAEVAGDLSGGTNQTAAQDNLREVLEKVLDEAKAAQKARREELNRLAALAGGGGALNFENYELPTLRQNIAMYQAKLFDVEKELVDLEVFWQSANNDANSPSAMNAAVAEVMAKDPSIAEYQQQMDELTQQIRLMEAATKDPNNASMEWLQQQLENTAKAMEKYRRAAEEEARKKLQSLPNEALRSAYTEYTVRKKAAEERRAKLQKQLKEANDRISEMAAGDPELRMLQADIKAQEALALALEQKIKEWKARQADAEQGEHGAMPASLQDASPDLAKVVERLWAQVLDSVAEEGEEFTALEKLRVAINGGLENRFAIAKELRDFNVSWQSALQSGLPGSGMEEAVAKALERDPSLAMYQQQLFALTQQIQLMEASPKNPNNTTLRRLRQQYAYTESAMKSYQAGAEAAAREKVRHLPNEAMRSAYAEYKSRRNAARAQKANIEKQLEEQLVALQGEADESSMRAQLVKAIRKQGELIEKLEQAYLVDAAPPAPPGVESSGLPITLLEPLPAGLSEDDGRRIVGELEAEGHRARLVNEDDRFAIAVTPQPVSADVEWQAVWEEDGQGMHCRLLAWNAKPPSSPQQDSGGDAPPATVQAGTRALDFRLPEWMTPDDARRLARELRDQGYEVTAVLADDGIRLQVPEFPADLDVFLEVEESGGEREFKLRVAPKEQPADAEEPADEEASQQPADELTDQHAEAGPQPLWREAALPGEGDASAPSTPADEVSAASLTVASLTEALAVLERAERGDVEAARVLEGQTADVDKLGASRDFSLVRLLFMESPENPVETVVYSGRDFALPKGFAEMSLLGDVIKEFRTEPYGPRVAVESEVISAGLQLRVTTARAGHRYLKYFISSMVSGGAARPFLSADDQAIADLAYRTLGLEVEPLVASDEERKLLKELGFASGVRIIGVRSGSAYSWNEDDILAGIHTWPVADMDALGEVLGREDLAELSPVKCIVASPALRQKKVVVRLEVGGGEAQRAGGLQSQYSTLPWDANAESGGNPSPGPSLRGRGIGEPHRLAAGDLVQLRAHGTLPEAPLHDQFTIEPAGTIPLGPAYGRVDVAGLTLLEAERAIEQHLETILTNVELQLTLVAANFTAASDANPSPGPSLRGRGMSEGGGLLYDGKTFGEWQELWKSELKVERRMEAIEALAAFARSGMGREAADTLLDVAGQYDFRTIDGSPEGKLKGRLVELLTSGSSSRVEPSVWLPALRERLAADPSRWRAIAAKLLDEFNAVNRLDEPSRQMLLEMGGDTKYGPISIFLRPLYRGGDERDQQVTQLLRQALTGPDRENAISALSLVGFDDLERWPEAFAQLLDADEQWSRQARTLLTRIYNRDVARPNSMPQVVSKLLEILKDPRRTQDHRNAARAVAVLPRFFESHREDREERRREVLDALKEILATGDPELYVPAAMAAFTINHPIVQSSRLFQQFADSALQKLDLPSDRVEAIKAAWEEGYRAEWEGLVDSSLAKRLGKGSGNLY